MERVYTIGRLDRDSEGLLLLTNDGELANALTHPRHHVSKVYHVLASHPLTQEQEGRMLGGVVHDGERLRALECTGLGETARGVRYRVVLGEGRKRQIRRMFDVFDIRVIRLQRVSVGSLQLGSLKTGAFRWLRPVEVDRLRDESGCGP
jgi:pseudouridine synthase